MMKDRSQKPGARSQKEENSLLHEEKSLEHEEHAIAFLLAPGSWLLTPVFKITTEA
ncbi:MAG: hypothetical protein QOD00_1315 [Blastocatellia bacterium]|nr:hypothetical protein [Blastocatellia bacterium]